MGSGGDGGPSPVPTRLPENVHSVATHLTVAGYERKAIDIGLGERLAEAAERQQG